MDTVWGATAEVWMPKYLRWPRLFSGWVVADMFIVLILFATLGFEETPKA